MPKSKQQKQSEALDRLRQHYKQRAEHWRNTRSMPVGVHYRDWVLLHGVDTARKLSEEADRRWRDYLQAARLDSSGNPL